MSRGAITPAPIAIPSSDAAFGDHVYGRRTFPRVVVRERTISGEAQAWYVYRDGAWGSSLSASLWDKPNLSRVTVSVAGLITRANATPR